MQRTELKPLPILKLKKQMVNMLNFILKFFLLLQYGLIALVILSFLKIKKGTAVDKVHFYLNKVYQPIFSVIKKNVNTEVTFNMQKFDIAPMILLIIIQIFAFLIQ